MDEPAFDDLHHAAVAGADGTWGIYAPYSSTPISGTPFVTASAFESFTCDPSPTEGHSAYPVTVKEEPVYLHFPPVPSSPTQPSLCSVASDDSFFHATQFPSLCSGTTALLNNQTRSNMPSSPVSSIGKSTHGIHRNKPPSTESHFSTSDLMDLKGTTAARSRKMTEEERRVMLHKRRLRNRASAARSREKRSRTLTDLTAEVEHLMKKAITLAHQANTAMEEARLLKANNLSLAKENHRLKAQLKQ